MRTASLVLGIVGGALAILIALFAVLGGIVFNSAANGPLGNTIDNAVDNAMNELEQEGWTINQSGEVSDLARGAVGVVGGLLVFYGILCVICGALGIVGGAIVKKHNVAAGVLMIIAAIPQFFSGIGTLASICLILGGIFAFVRDKSVAAPAVVQ